MIDTNDRIAALRNTVIIQHIAAVQKSKPVIGLLFCVLLSIFAVQITMKMSTHKFKMPSGVQCEILAANMGDFEDLLKASQKPNGFNEALSKVLAEKIVSVGNVIFETMQPYQREKFVNGMLPSDLDYCLLTMRQFAYDFPQEFTFFVEYNQEGKQVKQEFKFPLQNGNFSFQPTEKQHENYSEIESSFVFEFGEKSIKIPVMVGENAERIKKSAAGKTNLMPTDALALRGCAMKTDKESWLAMTAQDFKKMTPKAFNSILSEIEKREGKVFAQHTFTHPQTQQETTINLLATKDFFLSEV